MKEGEFRVFVPQYPKPAGVRGGLFLQSHYLEYRGKTIGPVQSSLGHRVKLFQNKEIDTHLPNNSNGTGSHDFVLPKGTPQGRRALARQECQEDLGKTHCLLRTLPFPQSWPMRLGVTLLRSRVRISRS